MSLSGRTSPLYQRRHLAGDLVSEREGHRTGLAPPVQVQVALADRRRPNAHEHLARRRSWRLELPRLQLPRFYQLDCFHLLALLPCCRPSAHRRKP
jgi:hypothetical protein